MFLKKYRLSKKIVEICTFHRTLLKGGAWKDHALLKRNSEGKGNREGDSVSEGGGGFPG